MRAQAASVSFGLSPGPSLSWVVQRPYSSLVSVPFDLTFPFVLMSWHNLCFFARDSLSEHVLLMWRPSCVRIASVLKDITARMMSVQSFNRNTFTVSSLCGTNNDVSESHRDTSIDQAFIGTRASLIAKTVPRKGKTGY